MRSSRLQHAMAAGYAQALRERTLAEQEAIAQAALRAQGVVAQALHASEARFRAVFEGAAIGIGIADLDGNVLQVNEALLRMFRPHRAGPAQPAGAGLGAPRGRPAEPGGSTTNSCAASASTTTWRRRSTAPTARSSGPT
ncbi:PAS domain-containing protein [Streptomyces tricolor]|nr:PAS domain-containing protein [Streptomyces tricolor]